MSVLNYGNCSSGGGNATGIKGFDYIEHGFPTISINPSGVDKLWLDLDTGKTWVCIDNTTDDNVWKCEDGTIVSSINASTFDILGDNSAKALWQLNGNADDTGGVYNGVWNGSAMYQTGIAGDAAYFDGNNNIEVDSSAIDNSVLHSVSLWVKFEDDTDNNNSGTFSKYDGSASNRFIFGRHNGKLSIFNGDNYGWQDSTVDLSAGIWHFIGFAIYDNATKLYHNGQLVMEINVKTLFSDIPINFGSTGPNNYYAVQTIDNIRIFNRTLTDNDFDTIYNIEKP